MRLNYYYNFKNTIRFFVNIENIIHNSSISYNDISWTQPFKFRIRKDLNSFRTLKIPNIYNFLVAYNIYQNELSNIGLSFETIEHLDSHKRMQISYELGEFKINSYSENQLNDYNNLVKYDKLIRIDIKSFYQNLYTHYIFDFSSDYSLDKPLSRMNNGRTAGIIMGNYLSLYFVELFSKKISNDLFNSFSSNNIDCEFSYFSDDFYIFCYNEDVNKIIKLFDFVLEKYDLEKNNEKLEILDYIDYTKNDLIEKFWKSVTRKCKNQQYSQKIINDNLIANGREPKLDNNLFFTNQLIYKLERINDYKKQKVFIVNFFKSNFYNSINFSNTYIDKYNYHQICYLIKQFPEICLYIDNIIDAFSVFSTNDFKTLIITLFKHSLKMPYHDEQLYYFYFIHKINILELLKDDSIYNLILESENQLLISYFIKYNLFSSNVISQLKSNKNEKFWFINYNLILYDSQLYSDLNSSIDEYLIPKNANNPDLFQKYKNFYNDNLKNRIDILYDLNDVKTEINDYLHKKWSTNENDLLESDDEQLYFEFE